MLYVVCYDFTSHTSLITLRYTTVADYYFARRHIVAPYYASDPEHLLNLIVISLGESVITKQAVSCGTYRASLPTVWTPCHTNILQKLLGVGKSYCNIGTVLPMG